MINKKEQRQCIESKTEDNVESSTYLNLNWKSMNFTQTFEVCDLNMRLYYKAHKPNLLNANPVAAAEVCHDFLNFEANDNLWGNGDGWDALFLDLTSSLLAVSKGLVINGGLDLTFEVSNGSVVVDSDGREATDETASDVGDVAVARVSWICVIDDGDLSLWRERRVEDIRHQTEGGAVWSRKIEKNWNIWLLGIS